MTARSPSPTSSQVSRARCIGLTSTREKLSLVSTGRSFSAIAAAEPYSLDLDTPDGPEVIRNWNVSEGFFEALGVRPVIGRPFREDLARAVGRSRS